MNYTNTLSANGALSTPPCNSQLNFRIFADGEPTANTTVSDLSLSSLPYEGKVGIGSSFLFRRSSKRRNVETSIFSNLKRVASLLFVLMLGIGQMWGDITWDFTTDAFLKGGTWLYNAGKINTAYATDGTTTLTYVAGGSNDKWQSNQLWTAGVTSYSSNNLSQKYFTLPSTLFGNGILTITFGTSAGTINLRSSKSRNDAVITTITGSTNTAVSSSEVTLTEGTTYYLTMEGTASYFTQIKWVPSSSCTATSISGNDAVKVDETITLSEASSVAGSWSVTSGSDKAEISNTGVVTGKAAGSATITFTPTDNTTYCTSTKEITINKGTPSPTFADGTYTIGGDDLDLSTLWTNGKSTGAVTYSLDDANGTGATVTSGKFKATTAGTATVKAVQAATDNYESVTKTATITVNNAPAIKYATSLNFEEQAAKSSPGSITDFLASGNMTISEATKEWDNAGTGYEGWKINTADVTITFWVQAGKQLTIELGEKTDAKVSLNGGTESTLSKSAENSCGIMSADTKVVIRTTSKNTTSIQKITITDPSTTYAITGATESDSKGTVSPTSITGLSGTTTLVPNSDKVYLGSNGSANYFTATPKTGYVFDKWKIGDTELSSSKSVTAATTITAYFKTQTFDVTIVPNDNNYGSVDKAKVEAVPYNSAISASSNVLTVNSTQVTASPKTQTDQYTYAFSNWSGIPDGGKVTGVTTVTANFSRTIRKYGISAAIKSGEDGYGSINPTSFPTTPVDYGTEITINNTNRTITIGNQTITATAKDATAEYTYAFNGWTVSPSGNTVTAATTATASFTRTKNQYTINALSLSNCSVTGTAWPTDKKDYGSSFSTTISAASGYTLPSSITVSGAEYTWDASTGALSITSVKGDVSVSITAVKAQTEPKVTWNVPTTVYPGGKYSFTVETNSDATLNVNQLTISGNGCSLKNTSLSDKVFSATLELTDAAAQPTITLTLPDGTSYSGKTSTSTPTLGSCSGGGDETIFSLVMKDNLPDETIKRDVEKRTLTSTDATISGASEVYLKNVDTSNDDRMQIKNSNILFYGGQAYVFINLNKALAEGDEISFTHNQSGTNQIGFTISSSRPSIVFTSENSYTIPANSSLIGSTELYVWRNNNSTYVKTLTITRSGSGGGGETQTPTMTWSEDVASGVTKSTTESPFTISASANTIGTVTYSLSNVSGTISINEATGAITASTAGSATVTATVAEVGCYNSTSISYNLTVTAPSYTITKASAEHGSFTVSAEQATAGTEITLSATPATGYQLGSWSVYKTGDPSTTVSVSDNKFKMPAYAVTIAATFTPQTYSITYKDQGGSDFSGTHASGYPTQYTYGVGATLKSATKTGYEFGGWFISSDCLGSAVTSIGTDAHENKTFYAQWDAIKVTKIELNQTSLTKTVGDADVTLNATVTPETALDRAITWSSSDATVASVAAEGVVSFLAAGNATITATAHDGSGKTATCTVTVKQQSSKCEGDTVMRANIPAPNQTKATVAYVDATKGGKVSYKLQSGSAPAKLSGGAYMIITGQFQQGDTLMVDLQVNDYGSGHLYVYSDSLGNTQITDVSIKEYVANTTTRDTAKYVLTQNYSKLAIVRVNDNQNHSLYSMWVVRPGDCPEPTDTYKYTIDLNGGTLSSASGWTKEGNNYYKMMKIGDTFTFPAVTKSECTFDKWLDQYNAEYEDGYSFIVTDDIAEPYTFTAQWTHPYAKSVDFMPIVNKTGTITDDGARIADTLRNYNYTISATDGLKFDNQQGAADGGFGIESTSRTLSFWVKANHKVTITTGTIVGVGDNDKRYATVSLHKENGDKISSEQITTSATKEYTTTQITEFRFTTQTITSSWNRIHQITITDMSPKTVSFDTHGGTPETISPITEESFGAGITLPAAPTKSGYIFDGWYTSATGGTFVGTTGTYYPFDNCTLYAHWAQYATSADFMELMAKYGSSGQYTDGVEEELNAHYYTADDVSKWYWDYQPNKADGGLGVNDDHTLTFWVKANQKVSITVGTLRGDNQDVVVVTRYDESGSKIDTIQIHGVTTRECTTDQVTKFVLTTPVSAGNQFWNRIHAINIGTTCEPHGLAYSTTSVNKTFGDGKFTNQLSNSHALAVTYNSSEEGVATVASDGKVTIVGAGTTTITAHAAEQTKSSTTYCEGSATYTLTVAKANPTASFSNGNYTIGGTTLDLSTLFSSPSTGAVTYSITDADETGATLAGSTFSATAAGTATVQASQAADDNYNAVVKTATINVTAASGGECEEIGYGTDTPITLKASSGSLQLAAVGSPTLETKQTPFDGAEQCNWIKTSSSSNYIIGTLGGSDISEITISMSTTNTSNPVCAVAFSSSSTFDANNLVVYGGSNNGTVYTFEVNATNQSRSDITITAPAGTKSFAIGRNFGFGVIVEGRPAYKNSEKRMLYYLEVCPTASSCTPPATTAITGETEYNEGNTIRLAAEYTGGSGEATYQWLKNGVAINGATGQIYTKADCTTDDAGYYSCEITLGGSCSKTTFATQVVVKGETCVAPVITTQPQSVSEAQLGSTITFTTVASGAAFYQWYTCDNQGNNLDPIEGANEASFTIPTSMQKVTTSYFRCRAIAACGESVLTNTVFASIVPIEFTINYGVYVTNSAIPSADEYAAFTQSKVVANDAKPYIKDAGLENISFHGTTTKPSGNGDGNNWSPAIAVPSSTSAEEYTEFSFFIERDFQINITEITLPVMLTTAGETHFTATLTDEIGTAVNGSLTLNTASQQGEISFTLSDEVNLVGKVTVKLSVYGKSYRIGKNIFLRGQLTSLPTPTIDWTSEALMPKSGTVADENAQIEATTNATSGATISYRSEQTNIADVVEDNDTYYIDYKTAGIANIIATVTGDGIHWNSNPPHSVSVNINVECTSPTLAWVTEPADLQVGGDNGSASVSINNSNSAVPEGLTLSFESSDDAIATVAQDGMAVTITPISAGEVAISATVTGDGKYYCTSATTVQKTITVAPAAGSYTVTFNMNGAEARDAETWSTSTVEEVTKPTRDGYNFIGWTVSQGLVPASAKWGTTNEPATAIATCSDLCNNANGNVFFRDLAAANGTVTLTANWQEVCNVSNGSTQMVSTLFDYKTAQAGGASTIANQGAFYTHNGISISTGSTMNTTTSSTTINNLTFGGYSSSAKKSYYFYMAGTETISRITIYFRCANRWTNDATFKQKDGIAVTSTITHSAFANNGDVDSIVISGTFSQGVAYLLTMGANHYYYGARVVSGDGGGSGPRTCVYVTYKANSNEATGSVMDDAAYTANDNTITIAKNDDSDNLGSFTRKGYTLKEWNTSANGDGTTYTLGQEVEDLANNLTLYAVWENEVTYTMAYDANGGTGTMTDDKSPYNPGSTVIVMQSEFTAPTNHEFDSWNTTAEGDGDSYQGGDQLTITSNTTLYAIWKEQQVAQEWTITYAKGAEGVEGDLPESHKVLSGNYFTLPDEGNLVKTNYSFTGWNDGENTYTAGQNYVMPNHDITLTAQWKINKQSDCENPTSGTYTFENNETVGTTTKAKAGNHESAFKIDNMSFSAMNAVYESGTGDYGGWKIKTSSATIEFCVEDECEVSINLGSIGSKSGMTITYTKPGATNTTTATLSANAINSYDIAAGTTITLTTTGSNTVTLKEIAVGDKCDVAPKYTDVYAYVKEGVAIAQEDKVLIGTVQLNGKYSRTGNMPSVAHGLTPVYDSETGNVYVYGTPTKSENSSITHNVTLTFTQTDCDDSRYEITFSAIIGDADAKRIAYVIDGTKNGGFDAYNQSRLSDLLYTKLVADFEVVPVNCYASVNETKIKNYYDQFDVVVITDYPNTGEKTNNVSYSNALGILVDVKPVLTMETFVSNLSNWKAKGLTSDPINPSGNDKTNVMTLLCNANDIFGTGASDHFKAGSTHTVTSDLTDPCLQGFAPMDAPDFVFIASINGGSHGTLITCCERQHEPAARMVVLGMQQKAYPKISDCGYDIVKGLINYLTISDAASIPDCSVIFDGHGDTQAWSNPKNWEGETLPTSLSPVRIDAPCVVSEYRDAKAGSIKIHIGEDNSKTYNGSLTIAPTGALAVQGSIARVEDAAYGTLLPTTASNLTVQADATNGSGVLVMGKEDGTNEATIEQYTLAKMSDNSVRYWQYIALPVDGINFMDEFYGKGVYTYLHDEPTAGGWIRVKDEEGDFFKAYGLTQPEEKEYTFTGHLAPTTSQTINLTHVNTGFNMIGNSWTAPIDITKFDADKDFTGGAEATIYIYNTGNDAEGGNTSAQGSTTAGQWISIPVKTAQEQEYDNLKVIPVGQAFEVKVKDAEIGTLKLDYNQLVMNGTRENKPMRAPARRATEETSDVDLMRIRVQGGNTHIDQYLLESAQFTTGFDNGWDGRFISGDDRAAKFYSVNNELGNMSVNALPMLEGTVLGFTPNSNQSYIVTFNYNGATTYYFNDLQTQQSTLIRAGESYMFTTSASDITNRFQISTTPYGSPIVTDLDSKHVDRVPFKFIEDEHLYIIHQGRLFDGHGKLIKQGKLVK